jgi:hypothetical protein
MTIGNVAAKFTIKMAVPEMIQKGFDTEGVVIRSDLSGSNLNIQCAMMFGGVVYSGDAPVTLKVSPKEGKATIATSKGR